MKRVGPWFHYAVCAVGLPLYVWAFHLQTQLSALPADFPPSGTAYPVHLEGEGLPPSLCGQAAGSRAELRFLAESLPPGTRLTVVSPEGRSASANLPRSLSLPGLIVTCASGLLFWIGSTFFFAPRATSAPVRDLFWSTFCYGLAIMIGGIHHPACRGWPMTLTSLLQITCLAVLPPIFVHLTLIFPRRLPVLDRARWLMPALWAMAAGLVTWQAIAYLRYFSVSAPPRFAALKAPASVADALLVLQVLAGFVILFTAGRRLELARERAQVKWLLWGFAVGVTPYVCLRTLLELFGVAAPFGPAFDRVFELAIPIAYVFAVVRYQFLDIDIIIRRSVIYAILALLMVCLYLTFVVIIGRRVEGIPPETALILAMAIGVGAGVMFQPLRRAIGQGVDRTFFKLTHEYGQALGALTRRLTRVHAQADLVRVTDAFLAETLRPQKHAVVLAEQGEVIGFGNVPPELMPALSTAAVALPPRTSAAPSATSLPEIEVDPLPAAFARAGVVLAAPLQVDAVTTGAILLGRKETERRYVEPDLGLLADAAREVARALERIRLVQTAAAEADARRRAEELDRLKSDFLSRVAHDLRSPLASILWSTDNLLDGIAGTLGEGQAQYLQSVKVSASHLNRLVSNLLDISRLEQGRVRIDLNPVNLSDVIDQALPTLRPLAEQKGVILQVDLRDPRPIQGNAEKLLEVVLNLVDNAIKFSPRGGTVEIRVEPAPRGQPELSVRDRGPGLGGVDPELLFQRFRQGVGSPHAPQQGFGLGLYIVKSYVELMHGEVSARDRGGGGAVFACTLPPADEAGGGQTSNESA